MKSEHVGGNAEKLYPDESLGARHERLAGRSSYPRAGREHRSCVRARFLERPAPPIVAGCPGEIPKPVCGRRISIATGRGGADGRSSRAGGSGEPEAGIGKRAVRGAGFKARVEQFFRRAQDLRRPAQPAGRHHRTFNRLGNKQKLRSGSVQVL